MSNRRPLYYGVSMAAHVAAIAGLIYIGQAETSGAQAPAPPPSELRRPPARPGRG